jgi:hypothetical protein
MLGKHERTKSGTFRKERDDSLVKNLREDYPELNRFNGNTKLGTLLDKYDVDSLSQLRKKIRK